jgi:hypothetical protein
VSTYQEETAERYRAPHMQAQWDQAAELFAEAFAQLKVPERLNWVTPKHLVIVAERQWNSLGNGGRLRPEFQVFDLHHGTLGEITSREQAAGVVEVLDIARGEDEVRAALRASIKAVFPR